jgi:hypothetical protein
LIYLRTITGPMIRTRKTMSMMKYKIAYRITRLFRRRDCLIE